MKKIVMLCATLLTLVATVACKSKVVIEDTSHFPDREIVKSSEVSEEDEDFLFDTINGWLTVGVTDTVVLSKLGKPDSIVYEGFMEFSGFFYTEWIYDGIVLDMESDAEGAPSSVFSIMVTSGNRYKTSRGVKVGDTKDRVYDRYKDILNEELTDKDRVFLGSIYGGTEFWCPNGKLKWIRIGSCAE